MRIDGGVPLGARFSDGSGRCATTGLSPTTTRVVVRSASVVVTIVLDPVIGDSPTSIGSSTSHARGASSMGVCSAVQICCACGRMFVSAGTLRSMMRAASSSCASIRGATKRRVMSMPSQVTSQRRG